MAEVNFYLKTPNNTKVKSLIYLVFSFNGKRLKYSTGESIMPTSWNSKSQKARSDNNLNDYLKKLSADVIAIERKLRTDGINVSPQLIRNELDFKYGKNVKQEHNLFSFIEDYITKMITSKRESTVKGYRNSLKHLKEYKIYKRKTLNFDDINQEFYNDYIDFLTIKKGFARNTIGKQIKNLKVFLTEASEAGLNKNHDFKNRKFKVLTEDVDTIYLNHDELTHIYNLDLSDNQKLEKVRDLFIVGCYTGLRFSDFSSIEPENIDFKNEFIRVKTVKMNNIAVIPIHKYVAQIIKKHHNALPPALSNQKMNDYLKEIGKIAEINEKIQVSHLKGTKRITNTYHKYELITTHTARRSFATNLYLADFPSISIMNITGHKTERAFMKYIRVTPEQHAQKLKKFWGR